MSAWGQVTDLVLLTLLGVGKGTPAAVADAAGIDAAPVRKALNRLSSGPMAKRKAHVTEWDHCAEGQRRYPRPVYAPGPGPNASRPPPKTHADSTRELNQRAQRILSTALGYVPQKRAAKVVAALRRKGVAA